MIYPAAIRKKVDEQLRALGRYTEEMIHGSYASVLKGELEKAQQQELGVKYKAKQQFADFLKKHVKANNSSQGWVMIDRPTLEALETLFLSSALEEQRVDVKQ